MSLTAFCEFFSGRRGVFITNLAILAISHTPHQLLEVMISLKAGALGCFSPKLCVDLFYLNFFLPRPSILDADMLAMWNNLYQTFR